MRAWCEEPWGHLTIGVAHGHHRDFNPCVTDTVAVAVHVVGVVVLVAAAWTACGKQPTAAAPSMGKHALGVVGAVEVLAAVVAVVAAVAGCVAAASDARHHRPASGSSVAFPAVAAVTWAAVVVLLAARPPALRRRQPSLAPFRWWWYPVALPAVMLLRSVIIVPRAEYNASASGRRPWVFDVMLAATLLLLPCCVFVRRVWTDRRAANASAAAAVGGVANVTPYSPLPVSPSSGAGAGLRAPLLRPSSPSVAATAPPAQQQSPRRSVRTPLVSSPLRSGGYGAVASYRSVNSRTPSPSRASRFPPPPPPPTAAYDAAGWLPVALFSWLSPLFTLGFRRQLNLDDLDPLPARDQAATWQAHMADALTTARAKALQQPSSPPSLVSVCWQVFGWAWLALGALNVLSVASTFAGPLLLHALLTYLDTPASRPGGSDWAGVGWAAAMCAAALVSALLSTQYNFRITRMQLRVRSALVAAVFSQAVTLHPESAQWFTDGQVTNFMSVDVQKVMDLVSNIHQLFAMPIQVAVTLYLLYREVQWAFVGGLGLMLFFLVINMSIAQKLGSLTDEMMQHKDQRVRLCAEALRGIKTVKMQAWEVPLTTRVAVARGLELDRLGKRKYLDAVCVYMWAATPVLVAVATFGFVLVFHPDVGSANAGTCVHGHGVHCHALSAASVFTALTLLHMLNFALNVFPWVYTGYVESLVSIRRLSAFLIRSRRVAVLDDFPHSSFPDLCISIRGSFAFPARVARDAWLDLDTVSRRTATSQALPDAGDLPPAVSATELFVKRGELVVVCGKVGTGKTALLRALLGHMTPVTPTSSATVQPGLSVAYAPQTPWVQHASLRDNILFGQPMRAMRYLRVLHATGLDDDMDTLPHGDRTIIGGRGVNLSGGQRQRLGVARALYTRTPLLLFDDPVSALDAIVARQVWGRGIGRRRQRPHGKQSMLDEERRARVVVTHNMKLALSADLLVVMGSGGKVLFQGPPSAAGPRIRSAAGFVAADAANGRWSTPSVPPPPLPSPPNMTPPRTPPNGANVSAVSLLPTSPADGRGTVTPSDQVARNLPLPTSPTTSDDDDDGTAPAVPAASPMTVGATTVGSATTAGGASTQRGDGDGAGKAALLNDDDDSDGDSDGEEHRQAGTLHSGTVPAYVAAVGCSTSAAVLLALSVMQLTRNGSDWWLSEWSDSVDGGSAGPGTARIRHDTRHWSGQDFLAVYGIIAGVNSVAAAARAVLFAYAGLRGARHIHNQLLEGVMAAPLAFFNKTPVGRLLNRFSRDQFSVDESLPFQLNILLAQAAGLCGTLLVLAYSTKGIVLVGLPFVAVLYYLLQRLYRATSRELKRLDSVTRSPLYAHFDEAVDGKSVVTAMGANCIQQQLTVCQVTLDTNQRAWFLSSAASQWLTFRLQALGLIVLALVSFYAVLSRVLNPDTDDAHRHTSPGLAGLGLSYALPIVSALQALISSFTDTEKEMVSVERAMEYTTVAAEGDTDGGVSVVVSPPLSWPSAGRITIRHLTIVYPNTTMPALHDVSLDIPPGQQVAVVGRTGAGKSTLVLALWRLVAWHSGSVTIDDVDVTTVPRRRLRQQLAVIPQEPLMFSGSVRYNLDPTHTASDADMVRALAVCGLSKATAAGAGEGSSGAPASAAVFSVGLDDVVEDSGGNWSVGQRQLLCLARALLRKARVVCLDEATSSVDSHTASRMQAVLATHFASATRIVVAHRQSTVAQCDRVVTLAGGRVVRDELQPTHT